MNKIQPNSFEAIAMFVLYICFQDDEISLTEINQFESDLNILKKLYLDIHGELLPFDFKESLQKISTMLKKNDKFLSTNLSKFEKDTFQSIITDPKLRHLALLEAKHAAESDKLHAKENAKLMQWLKLWNFD